MSTQPNHSSRFDAGQPVATTVGILFPGEMGAALGRALAAKGLRVVSTANGRSGATAAGARQAGMELLECLDDVVRAAEIVISLVSPAAAVEVAQQYAERASLAPADVIYVDANSIAPATIARVAATLAASGIEVVDAAIYGLAARLSDRGCVYLSGERASTVARLLENSVRTRVVSNQLGSASQLKMFIGGLNKGLAALFFELAVAARQAGNLDETLAAYRDHYPELMDVIARVLPSYPEHSARRADEMSELEKMLLGLGLRPGAIRHARRLFRALGAGETDAIEQTADVESVVTWAHERLTAGIPVADAPLACGPGNND